MSDLRIRQIGPVSVWTIYGPSTKNALDFEVMAAMVAACNDLASCSDTRAIVLTGDGETFVSGGDLKELRDSSTEGGARKLADAGRAVTSALADLKVPVIAALAGPAIGGGAELAIACDLRVASPRARLQFKHARMGVTPAWNSTDRLQSLVGVGHAARLLLTGESIDAAAAHAIGLVDRLVTVDDSPAATLDAAVALCNQIAAGAPQAVAHIKRLLRRPSSRSTVKADHGELESFVATWSSHDHDEAVTAYFERRAPLWTGR